MTSYTVIAETFLRIIRKLKSPWRINHNGAKYAACSHHLLMNMELALEVEHSVAIKRKKPWPKLCWLGEEQYGLFLLDSTRISQLSLSSGKTKRTFPSLNPVLQTVILFTPSRDGSFLAGLTEDGRLFKWQAKQERLTTFQLPFSSENNKLLLKGCKLFISNDGSQVLLVTALARFYLWEETGSSDESCSQWWQIIPPAAPESSAGQKKIAMDACFYTHPVLGDCCSCITAHCSEDGGPTTLTHLLLRWPSTSDLLSPEKVPEILQHTLHSLGQVKRIAVTPRPSQEDVAVDSSSQALKRNDLLDQFSVWWKSMRCASEHGARSHLVRLSPGGDVAAVAINRVVMADTRVMFLSPLSPTASLSLPLLRHQDHTKKGRGYWIADMSWSADGLLLVCVLKQGSLCILPRYGQPLKLITHGCSMDMGPAYFLPLHPLISVVKSQDVLLGTSLSSERDSLRQRFSVSTHPFYPVLLCSDGYMVSTMTLPASFSLTFLVRSLVTKARLLAGLSPMEDLALHEQPNRLNVPRQHEMSMTSGGFTDTFNSSCGSMRPLGAAGTNSGVLQFIGLDEELDRTSKNPLEPAASSKSLVKSLSTLLTAWSIAVSTNLSRPGNSIAPCYWSPTLEEHSKHDLSQHQMIESVLPSLTQLLTIFLNSKTSHDTNSSQLTEILRAYGSFLHIAAPIEGLGKPSYPFLSMLASLCSRIVHWTSSLSSSCTNRFSLIRDTLLVLLDILDESTAYLTPSCQQLTPVYFSLAGFVFRVRDELGELVNASKSIAMQDKDSFDAQARELDAILEGALSQVHQGLMECGFSTKELNQNSLPSDLLLKAQDLYCCGSVDEALQTLEDTVEVFLLSTHDGASTRESVSVPLSLLYIYMEKIDLMSCLNLCHRLITNKLPSSSSHLSPAQSILQFGASLQSPAGPLSKLMSHESLQSHRSQESLLFSSNPELYFSSDSGYVVASSLALLMADYFCGRRMLVLSPMQPHPLIQIKLTTPQPPLKWLQLFSNSLSVELRMVEMNRSDCLSAISRENDLAKIWTPEHALELLLLCGLWCEAASLTSTLGDWKSSFILLSIHLGHLKKIGERLPQDYLEHVQTLHQAIATKRLNDIILSEQVQADQGNNDAILQLLSHLFLGCAMVEQDEVLVSGVIDSVGSLVELCRSASLLVDRSVMDLPSPPPYCPQPTSTAESSRCLEYSLRHNLASITRKVLSLMKASSCLSLLAHSYCKQLVTWSNVTDLQSTLVSVPHWSTTARGEPDSSCLPDGLTHRARITGDFQRISTVLSEDAELATSFAAMESSFRSLCSLLWYLHCREQASIYCRRLFTISTAAQVSDDSGDDHRKAVYWCLQLIPFSDSLCGTQESLDSLLLSVLAELPPDQYLVDSLAYAFPNDQKLSSTLAAKLDRILTQLRSASSFSLSSSSRSDRPRKPQPLSVSYVGQTQAVTDFLDLLQDGGKFCHSCRNTTNVDDCFLFELDSEYHQFLDTLLSVIDFEKDSNGALPCSQSSLFHQLLHSSAHQPSNSPLLSAFCKPANLIGKQHSPEILSFSRSSCENMTPLLTAFDQWSRIRLPSITIPCSHSKSSIKSSDGVEEPFPGGELFSSHIRVNFFLPFLVNCLQVTEEQLLLDDSSLPSLTEESSSMLMESLECILPTTASELQVNDEPKIDILTEPGKLEETEVANDVLQEDDEKQMLGPADISLPSPPALKVIQSAGDIDAVTASDSNGSYQPQQSDDLTKVTKSFETNVSSSSALELLSSSLTDDVNETVTFGSTTLPLTEEADGDHRASLSTAEQLTDLTTTSLDEGEMKKEDPTEEEEKAQEESLPSVSETSISDVTFSESSFQPVTARSEWRNDWTETEEDETEDTDQQQEKDERGEDENEREDEDGENEKEDENEEEAKSEEEISDRTQQSGENKGTVIRGVVHLAVSGSNSAKRAAVELAQADTKKSSKIKKSKEEKRVKKAKNTSCDTSERQDTMAAEMRSLQKQLLRMSQLMVQQKDRHGGRAVDRAQSTSRSASPPRLCMTDLESLSLSAISDEIPPPLLLRAPPSGDHDLSEVTDTQLSPGAMPKLNLGMSTQESDQEDTMTRNEKKTRKEKGVTRAMPLLKTAPTQVPQQHKPSFSEAYPGVDSFLKKLTYLEADAQSLHGESQDEVPVAKLPLLTIRDDSGHPPAVPVPSQPLPRIAWGPSPSYYHPPSPSHYRPPSPSHYRPPSPSHYRPPTPSHYHPSSPSHYHPSSPSHYHPPAPSFPTTFPNPIEFIPPNVPIQPFIPRLVPPTAVQPHPTTHSLPPLLSLSDPISRMRQDGYQLLQLPSRGEGLHCEKKETVQTSSMKNTTASTVRRRRRVRIQLSESQQSASQSNKESISTQLCSTAANVTGQAVGQKENHPPSPDSEPPSLSKQVHKLVAASDREACSVSSTPRSSPKTSSRHTTKHATSLQDTGTQTLSNTDTASTSLSSSSSSSSSYSIHLEQWSTPAKEEAQTMVSIAVQVSPPPGMVQPTSPVVKRPELVLAPHDEGGSEFIRVDDIEEQESTIVGEELEISAWSSLSSVSTLEDEEGCQKLPHPDSDQLELPVKTTGLPCRAPLLTPQSLILSEKKRTQPAMSEALQRFRVIDEQLSAIERSAGTVASEIEGSRQVLSTIDRFHPSHKRFQTRSKTADTHLRRKSPLLAVNNTTLETADIASEARRIPDNVGVTRKEEIDLSDTRIEDTYPFRLPENTTMVGHRTADTRQQLITEKRPLGEDRDRNQATRMVSRNHSTPHEKREDRRRELHRDYHKQRVEEAYALMNDLLSTSKPPSAHSSTKKPPLGKPTNPSFSRERAPQTTKESAQPNTRHQPSNRTSQQMRQPYSNRLTRSSGPLQSEERRGKMRNGTSSTVSLTQDISELTRSRKAGEKRKLSSVEGLDKVEQGKIADILANTEYDQLSISSGSITSSIDWSRVDDILTS